MTRRSDIQMVSRHRFDGVARPVIRGRTGLVAVGPACSRASGLRPSSDRSLLCARHVAIEHTGGHRHASRFCHASAWHHHLLSDRSGALSPPYAGTVNAGGARDRGFRKGADGGSPAISLESQAKATRGKPGMAGAEGAVRQNNRREGLRVGEPTRIGRLSWPALGRTSNVSELGVTGGESAATYFNAGWSSPVARLAHNQEAVSSNLTPATNSVSDGATYGSLPLGESEPSVTLVRVPSEFSSGDGLGIHQPGSNTRGFAVVRQPASGRARDRAMCPAVAWSFAGRAA